MDARTPGLLSLTLAPAEDVAPMVTDDYTLATWNTALVADNVLIPFLADSLSRQASIPPGGVVSSRCLDPSY